MKILCRRGNQTLRAWASTTGRSSTFFSPAVPKCFVLNAQWDALLCASLCPAFPCFEARSPLLSWRYSPVARKWNRRTPPRRQRLLPPRRPAIGMVMEFPARRKSWSASPNSGPIFTRANGGRRIDGLDRQTRVFDAARPLQCRLERQGPHLDPLRGLCGRFRRRREIECRFREGSPSSRLAFRRRPHAVRDVLPGRLRHASRLCAALRRLARLHSPASGNGRHLL